MIEIKRKYYEDLIEKYFLKEKKITFLLWARRVWKTFLMRKFYERLASEAVWISFEEDIGRKFSTVDEFLNYLKIASWKNSFKYIFLDEIQLVPGISRILKKIFDSGYNYYILCSGSGSFKIYSEIEDSLVGRREIIKVYPLTFEEFFYFKTWKTLQFVWENRYEWILDKYYYLIEEFLKFWGYPEVVISKSIEDKVRFLKSIYDMWIDKDIKFILSWEDIINFSRFLKSIAVRVTSIVKYSTISGELWITLNKVKKFIQILKDSFIIFGIWPLAEKYSYEIKTGEKLYFVDNGLLNYILKSFVLVDNIWKIVENYVIWEHIKRKKDYIELYFWKKINQSEIDLVVYNMLSWEYTPVEIKAKSTSTFPKIFKSFSELYNVKKWILYNKSIRFTKKVGEIDFIVIPYFFVDIFL